MAGWNLSGPALYFILSCIPSVFEEQVVKLGSRLTKWFTSKQGYFCKQWESPVVEYLFIREENKMRLFEKKKKSCQKVFTVMEMPQWCCDLHWHEVQNNTSKFQKAKDSQFHTQDVTRNKVVEENKDQILNCGQRSWRKAAFLKEKAWDSIL